MFLTENSILKRIIIMVLLCAVLLGVFFAGAWIFYRMRSNEIEQCVRDFDAAYRAVYLCAHGEGDADLEQLPDTACAFLCDALAQEYAQPLSDAVAELSDGSRTVEKYDRIFTEISVDYRYGGIRVYAQSVVDYNGYGGYLFDDEDENIGFAGRCTQTLQMTRENGAWKISSIKTEYHKD